MAATLLAAPATQTPSKEPDMASSGDLRARLIGSLYFIPLLIAMVYGQPLSALAGCTAIGWLAYEAVVMLRGAQRGWLDKGLWAVLVLAFWPAYLPLSGLQAALVGTGLWGAALVLNKRGEHTFVSLLFLASFSLGAMLAKDGGHLVLICLAAVISAGDVGAYLFGRVFGGPKLAPHISPSKTWSGAVGGLACSLLVVAGLSVMFGAVLPGLASLVFAVGVCVLAQSGDLFESSLKRRLGIKDSGSFVPGHGGALDRFDGYLAALPVVMLADAVHFTPVWLQVSGL